MLVILGGFLFFLRYEEVTRSVQMIAVADEEAQAEEVQKNIAGVNFQKYTLDFDRCLGIETTVKSTAFRSFAQVIALPCGSASMRRTRRFLRANSAAALIESVVFPTPPFWFKKE